MPRVVGKDLRLLGRAPAGSVEEKVPSRRAPTWQSCAESDSQPRPEPVGLSSPMPIAKVYSLALFWTRSRASLMLGSFRTGQRRPISIPITTLFALSYVDSCNTASHPHSNLVPCQRSCHTLGALPAPTRALPSFTRIQKVNNIQARCCFVPGSSSSHMDFTQTLRTPLCGVYFSSP